jgi:hypothetical protein
MNPPASVRAGDAAGFNGVLAHARRHKIWNIQGNAAVLGGAKNDVCK